MPYSLLYPTLFSTSLANIFSVSTCFILYSLQINSIFIHLKYFCGQQTINLLFFIYKPSSSKVINNIVFRLKNITITIVQSKPLDFYLIYFYTFLLSSSCGKELFQSLYHRFKTVIPYSLKSSIIFFCHSIALLFSMLPAKKTDFPVITYIVSG